MLKYAALWVFLCPFGGHSLVCGPRILTSPAYDITIFAYHVYSPLLYYTLSLFFFLIINKTHHDGGWVNRRPARPCMPDTCLGFSLEPFNLMIYKIITLLRFLNSIQFHSLHLITLFLYQLEKRIEVNSEVLFWEIWRFVSVVSSSQQRRRHGGHCSDIWNNESWLSFIIKRL